MSEIWLHRGLPFWIVLTLLGLSLGSFLNVVIYRLPLGLSLWRPRSQCPHCRSPIAARDNIPLLSYLVLRGRCRHCRARIRPRYPAVELAAALCVLVSVLVSPGPAAAAARATFLLALVAVTLIDLEHRIIPDEISLPGIALGLIVCPLLNVPRLDALIGALVGFGGLLAIAAAYRAVRGVPGMGGGDIKLAGMLGAFLGWKGVLMATIAGSLIGALVGIALLVTRRGTGKTALPFGSFLAPAAGLVLLVGPRLWAWYAGLIYPARLGSW